MKTKLGLQKQRPREVLLFCAIMHPQNINTCQIEQILLQELGEIYQKSESINFSAMTKYYQTEMGDSLYKYLISFKNLHPIDNLHLIKRKMVTIEEQFQTSTGRIFNIDPGYLSLGKTNMFTTKDYVNRVYIADGIFGEVNLIYSKQQKTYEPCFNTYPDFKSTIFRNFLNEQRNYYEEFFIQKTIQIQ